MPSEMRRAAKALVESRVESFPSHHPLEASKARLERALAGLGAARALELRGTWSEREGHIVYEAAFGPAAGTRRFLHAVSLVLVLLIGSSAWALYAAPRGAAVRFLLPLATLLAVVAMPFVVNAAASRREAQEARIRRAIRLALQDASPADPPRQRWDDEE